MNLDVHSYMNDWVIILSIFSVAIVTILLTIVIVWILVKRSLYTYQYKQDLKETEVRLINAAKDVKFNINESIIRLFTSKLNKIPSSIHEDEAIVRLLASFSGFDFLLEEVKTKLAMSQSTQKEYKQKMSDLIHTILEFTKSEIVNDWYNKLNLQIDSINSIFNELIQFIHSKISRQLEEFDKK
ncbi:MAG: hypothetical protein ACTSX6_12860 [Candidatus Heimdallarchaeaceae archaeon]